MKEIKFGKTLRMLLDNSHFNRNKKKFCGEVGISTATLTQYMNEQTNPGFLKLVKITEILDVSLDYLVFGTSEQMNVQDVDISPMAKYIDMSLSDLQIKSSRTNMTALKIADILSEKIMETAKSISEGTELSFAEGIITENEAMTLEKFSTGCDIFSTNLEYDVIMIENENPAAGKFLDVVALNINRGFNYRFLLPKYENRKWNSTVSTFRNLLYKRCTKESVAKSCRFGISDCSLITGFSIYNVSPEIVKEQPLLYRRIENFIFDNSLAYTIPPSREPQSVLLMDSNHIKVSKKIFNELWKSRKEI